jgi:branched-chain amino acid transport system substrate-binding protein
MPRSSLLIGAAAAFSAFAAIGLAPGGAAEPYRVNVILPLTGGASFLGRGEQQALQIFEKLTNDEGGIKGTPLAFTYHDDQTSPQISVQITNAIIADKPAVMLGSSIVAMCNAVGPLLRNGPFDYCLSPGIHPAAGSYQYSSDADTLALIEALVRYFRLRGLTKIAFMSSTDATGQDAERGFNETLKLPENASITVTARQRFNPTDVSVSAQIERIKESQPQALIAWSTGAPIATVFKGLLAAGVNLPVGSGNGNQTYAQMLQYKDFLPHDLYITTSVFLPHEGKFQLDPRVEEQQKKFYAAFAAAGAKPDAMAALAWDPALIVTHALGHLGLKATAQQVRAFVAGETSFAGVNGIYDFQAVPQRGLTTKNALVTRWDAPADTWTVVSEPAGAPLPK